MCKDSERESTVNINRYLDVDERFLYTMDVTWTSKQRCVLILGFIQNLQSVHVKLVIVIQIFRELISKRVRKYKAAALGKHGIHKIDRDLRKTICLRIKCKYVDTNIRERKLVCFLTCANTFQNILKTFDVELSENVKTN